MPAFWQVLSRASTLLRRALSLPGARFFVRVPSGPPLTDVTVYACKYSLADNLLPCDHVACKWLLTFLVQGEVR